MKLNYEMPVLVVDDYKLVADIVRKMLKQAGFSDVDEATNGEEAISKMRERDYGLVISDWYMEPTGGMELLRQAKSDEKLRDVPFIMISAEAAQENISQAKAEGASAYVVKPFDAHTLRSRIATAMAA